jgi:hypothetical protein
MNSLGIQENLTGFGEMGGDAVEQLRKALTAGSGANAGTFTGGRALIPESLEATLVNILFTQKDAVLFQSLKKKTIKSPVHQWDTRTEVGADDGAWVDEAGASIADANQTIQRVFATVKYLQTQRTVTLQATLSDMIEPAMAIEQNAGALWICRNIEKALFYGDHAMVTQQIDGIEEQITAGAPSNIIDMQGASANSTAFEDAIGASCRQIRDNYGRASLIMSSTMVMQDIQRLLRDRVRFPAGGGQAGAAVIDKYPTPFGEPDLKYDLFIREGTVPAASALTANRPGAAPVIGAVSYPTDSSSLFTSSNAGVYYYKVVPTNQYGDGPAVTSAALTVASGQNVTIPVTVGAAPLPTAYKLYRSKLGASDGTDCRYMFSTAYTTSPMNLVDENLYLPGTSSAYVLTMEDLFDAIEFFQFLPLMKFDLYPTNSAVYPFLMLLFGALALKKPTQHMRIKNIAPDSLGWY